MATFNGQAGSVNAQPGFLEPGIVVLQAANIAAAAYHVNVADFYRFLLDVGDQPREGLNVDDNVDRQVDAGEHPMEALSPADTTRASVNVGAANG